MIKSEFIKLHRCNIIWVGIIVLPFAPLLAVLQQSSLNDPVMDYGYINLINAVIWNNMALFLPATLTLLGGYMMNREYIDDTLKEIFIIPVSYRKLMAGKLGALYLLAVMYSIYNFCITTIISIFYCPAGLTVSTFMKSFFQICGMGIFICTAVMPVVCWCGSSKNRYLAGTVLSFIYGFFSIPVCGHNFQDFYPVSAGLSLIAYTGNPISYRRPDIAVLTLSLTIFLSLIVLHIQNKSNKN